MTTFVAISGASGVIYAVRLLARLLAADRQVALSITPMGAAILRQELGIEVDLERFDAEAFAGVAAEAAPTAAGERVRYYRHDDLTAPMASGSARVESMVIVPCSMGRLARIAAGTADDLISRAADVMLKERRRLILVPREAPLSSIHLANMKTLSDAGAIVLPACPAFYHRPTSIEELADTVVERILDHLSVENEGAKRWGQRPK